jgi:hypothetical protein
VWKVIGLAPTSFLVEYDRVRPLRECPPDQVQLGD